MKHLSFLYLLIFISLLSFSSCNKKEEKPKIKYVFLFIGDGMGINHVYISDMYLRKQGLAGISFLNFPNLALTKTNCLDEGKITDSGAGGTAISSGKKTQFYAIGMNRQTGEKFKSIAEIARDNGWKVGIISNVGLNHATPASFYAHVPWRNMYNVISQQMWNSDFDFFAGGGIITQGNRDSMLAIVWDSLKANDYTVVLDKKDFDKALKTSKKVFLTDTLSLNKDNMYYFIDSLNRISLADFTRKAIEFLDNEKGFFLMVEGGKIDWASHANDVATMIYEVYDFDKAIAQAYEFYKKHKDETIIIITSDHETGGLSFGYTATKYDTYLDSLSLQYRSKEFLIHYLREMGAETYAFPILLRKWVKFDYKLNTTPNTNEAFYVNHLIDSLQHKSGISWASNFHTATLIPSFAIGKGSQAYKGIIDNTFTFHHLLKLTGLKK